MDAVAAELDGNGLSSLSFSAEPDGCSKCRLSSGDIHLRVADSLERVGMSHRKDHRPSELSGGEQQRVAIARAVVHDPRVILADEPTGNLDAHQASDIMALLHRIARDQGQTVILATHSEMAAQMADSVYYLEDGFIHQRSTPRMNVLSQGGTRLS